MYSGQVTRYTVAILLMVHYVGYDDDPKYFNEGGRIVPPSPSTYKLAVARHDSGIAVTADWFPQRRGHYWFP